MVVSGEMQYPQANVAILLATYNGEKFLSKQLDSIIEQTYRDFVCFIHDDGSIDNTVDIIKKYCNDNPEHFVYLGNDKCGGAKQNFMHMLRIVDADYFMFCDQDDYWLNTKIEKCLFELKKIEDLEGQNTPGCVYSDVKVVSSNLSEVSDSYYSFMHINGKANSVLELLKHNVVIGCTMMINRALQRKMITVKDLNNIFMHDWWGALVCSAMGTLSFINESLVFYRQHIDNVVGAKVKYSFFEKLKRFFSFRKWVFEKRKWIDRPRKFALELAAVIPSDNSNYSFLSELSMIKNQNKIKRLAFYLQNDLLIKENNIVTQLLFI